MGLELMGDWSGLEGRELAGEKAARSALITADVLRYASVVFAIAGPGEGLLNGNS